MANNNRPVGRQKRVGTGTGNVSRRGSGVSHKTGGRTGGIKFNSSGSGGFRNGSTSSGGQRNSSPKMSLFSIIAFLVIAFVIFKFMSSGDEVTYTTESMDIEAPSDNYVSSADEGAYQVNDEVSENARDKRTIIRGNGEDIVTLMIYMIGTDLESKSGMATADLQEMLNANITDQVNIIVETGGTKTWKNDVISNKTNQRYQIKEEGLLLLEDNLGKQSMVNPDTLTDFIQYCEEEFPADRYQLIMWDHGGGSLAGFGYDELFPGDHMTLDEIQEALNAGNVNFDFVGFDACLMGTLETALVLEPFSDYMLASEELEPGIGWYYTDWISELSNNTSIETRELGKLIIDDYISEVEKRTPKSQATLSLVDLAELKAEVPKALIDFSKSTNELIESEQYRTVATARAGAKEFSKAQNINQIDLIDFASRMGTEDAQLLVEVLESAIKYNRTSQNINNANGLSIYFPYNKLSKLDDMLDTYEEIDMEDEYMDCVKSFANMAAGGQVLAAETGNSSGPVNTLLGSAGSQIGQLATEAITDILGDFLSGDGNSSIATLLSGASWLQPNKLTESAAYYSENQFDPSKLIITEKNGQQVIDLTEEQWALVEYMEMNVFIDDGEGFINLGLDNVYEWNDEGDLIMDYDETWMAINKHIVSYYLVSEDRNGNEYSIRGRVPAMLNDEYVNLIIEFNQDEPYGNVLGAQVGYDEESETSTAAKGLIEIVPGDQIDYLCDYYTYGGVYTDSYYLGETVEATGEWYIENLKLDDYNYKMTYRFTDVYNNQYWSEVITNE